MPPEVKETTLDFSGRANKILRFSQNFCHEREKMKAYFDNCKLVECLHVQNKLSIFSNKLGPDFPANICRLCSQKLCGFYFLFNAFSLSNPYTYLQWLTIFEKKKKRCVHVGNREKKIASEVVRNKNTFTQTKKGFLLK